MASQQEVIPTNSFSLVQVVVVACQQLSIPRQSTGRREQNTFSHCMYRRRHFVSTSHMMLHAHAWLKLNSVPKTYSHSISCFAPCLAQAQGLSRPEYTGQIHETLEVTVLRSQNLAHNMKTMAPREIGPARGESVLRSPGESTRRRRVPAEL